MSRSTTRKKITLKTVLYGLLGLAGVALVAIIGLNMLGGQKSEKETAFTTASAKEGKLKSSTLLTGKVKATEEQYVYYDANKGDLKSVAVNVGDQVQVGQVLASYDSTEAQRNYDTAVRALNKIDRQIHHLKTYGQPIETTGDEATDSANTASAQRSVDSQLKDLNDSRADALDAVNKAQEALNATNETSTVNGTVVEVKKDVSKSNTSTAQTVVHVVNSGSLIIEGEMSEYNLANIAAEQEVTITSKVYPDKTWSGKVKSVSDYPTSSGSETVAAADSGGSGASSSSAKYPFKVELTSEWGELKQGFTVNIEVNASQSGILVPVEAVVSKGDKHYVYTYDAKKKTVRSVEVQLGEADGANQQIASGLKSGETVIANPDKALEDGQEVTVDGSKTD